MPARTADVRRDQSNADVSVYWLSEVALHMTRHLDRREFIQLAGLATAGGAGVVFSSGLRGVSFAAGKGRAEDFMFLQMSDLHWRVTGPPLNPDAEGTLDKAIAHVTALPHHPDCIVFTD